MRLGTPSMLPSLLFFIMVLLVHVPAFWFSISVIATFANEEIKPAKYYKSIMFEALDLNPLS